MLGPVGKKLPLAWLADLAKVPRSTLKNAASRDSLSYDVAWQIAGLFDDDRAATVEWLRKGTRRAPSRPRMDSAGSSETQSVGVITQRPDRAERLAGIAFASELMRNEFVRTPALIAVAQRLIEGANPPDVATIAGAVYDVLAGSPRARTAEGRRDLALALTGLAKQLAEARFPRTHGLLDLARLLLHEESAIL